MKLLEHEPPAPDYMDELRRVYGEGVDSLTDQIAADDPNLSDDEVVMHAWSLMPGAPTFMMSAQPEDLLANALALQAEYTAIRRFQG